MVVKNMERLQKVLASSGVASRRKSEELILAGRVFVNGEKITSLGTKVDGGDIITVDGKQIQKENKEYYLLNKPRGVVTTTKDEKGRKTVIDLIPTHARIYPVGRLDYDTTGVLLLTNDGDFASLMMHPKNEVDKVYIAKVKGIMSGTDIEKLKSGVVIENTKVYPTRVKLRKVNKEMGNSIVEMTIHEGKNHQVKKMFASIGFDVLKLKRERFGFLTTENLASGEYRKLNPKEVKQLHHLVSTYQQQKNIKPRKS